MYAVKDTPHILIINPALPFFPSPHFSAVSVRSTAALAAAAAYLCRCGSWCWGSTDARSCHTGTPRTAELWSGHGKTYRPRQCHRSGTGCRRLTSTGRSGRRSEQSHIASGGNIYQPSAILANVTFTEHTADLYSSSLVLGGANRNFCILHWQTRWPLS